jgi:hypothetical protein
MIQPGIAKETLQQPFVQVQHMHKETSGHGYPRGTTAPLQLYRQAGKWQPCQDLPLCDLRRQQHTRGAYTL